MENRTSVDVVFFDITPGDNESFREHDMHGAGAMHADEEVKEGGEGFIYLRVPSNDEGGYAETGALHVRPPGAPKPKGYPSWVFKGDVTKPETFSLEPSIHLRGAWHGWLRGGRLESC